MFYLIGSEENNKFFIDADRFSHLLLSIYVKNKFNNHLKN